MDLLQSYVAAELDKGVHGLKEKTSQDNKDNELTNGQL